ncbi:MAG: MarR family winged helix-turn-helix transcriptional regulator [Micromonosporaceae bacterium]
MTESEHRPDDLLDSSHWRPLWRMLSEMDRDIAALYAEAGISDVSPRFVGPLIKLGRHEPMTIQQLADAVEVTHSAMSQTVAALRKADLVESAENVDGRTRRIQLSGKGRELLPFLRAEWRATEATVRELEAETPYPVSRAVRDIQAALAKRSFRQRLADNLAKARDGRLT